MGDRRNRRFRRSGWRSSPESDASRQRPADEAAADAVTLASLDNRRKGIVTGYRGGEGARRKAMELGLVPGAPVEVVMRGAGRLLVVRVEETRIMVGHGVARQVRVLEKE